MWNLPRRAVEELVDGHRLPMDIDTLWRLTGDNPKAIQRIDKRFRSVVQS